MKSFKIIGENFTFTTYGWESYSETHPAGVKTVIMANNTTDVITTDVEGQYTINVSCYIYDENEKQTLTTLIGQHKTFNLEKDGVFLGNFKSVADVEWQDEGSFIRETKYLASFSFTRIL